jgi:hypothetical protein
MHHSIWVEHANSSKIDSYWNSAAKKLLDFRRPGSGGEIPIEMLVSE